jgi:hypothetical protein
MKRPGLLPIAVLALVALGLMAPAGPLRAGPAQEPVEIAQLPYIEIFSPTFFWNDETDTIRSGSTTCPKGRAIAGGVSIVKGKASLRMVESYPDGESWVMRVVNRQQADTVQSLQVRGFALCMLPAARKASVLMVQNAKLSYLSTKFEMPTGYVSTASRQACRQGGLVGSGGFGIDPDYRGPSNPRLELSYPDPEGWNVRAVNGAPGSAAAADARIYAVCLGGKEGIDVSAYKYVYFASSDVIVKFGNGAARQSVSCGEKDSYVLAGGARAIKGRSASIEIQESFPDSPSSWTVAVNNRGDKKAGNVTMKLYAVCIKK